MPFVKGIVIKGQGRPKGISRNLIDSVNERLRFRYKKSFPEMLEKQIDKAKIGSLPAFIYLTDRVLGKPIESIKMVSAIKLVMDE